MAKQIKKQSKSQDMVHQKVKIALLSSIVTAMILVVVVCVISLPSAIRERRTNEIITQVLGPKNENYAEYGLTSSDPAQNLRMYLFGKTVDETKADIKQRAEKAGFKLKHEKFSGRQLHFQNNRGEWLIVDLTSKPQWDRLADDMVTGGTGESTLSMDQNAAPTLLYIHVNLSKDE